jgi:hypothetical protein
MVSRSYNIMDLVGISDFDENEVLLMIDDGVIARMRKKSKEVPKTQHLKANIPN